MKQFFEQYGGVALGILALLVLIAMITPVGNIIKTSLQGTVTKFSGSIESQTHDGFKAAIQAQKDAMGAAESIRLVEYSSSTPKTDGDGYFNGYKLRDEDVIKNTDITEGNNVSYNASTVEICIEYKYKDEVVEEYFIVGGPYDGKMVQKTTYDRTSKIVKERENYRYKSSKYYKRVEKNLLGTDYKIEKTPILETQFASDGSILNHFTYTYFDGTINPKLTTKTSFENGYAGNIEYVVDYNSSGASKKTEYKPDGSVKSQTCKDSNKNVMNCSLF